MIIPTYCIYINMSDIHIACLVNIYKQNLVLKRVEKCWLNIQKIV